MSASDERRGVVSADLVDFESDDIPDFLQSKNEESVLPTFVRVFDPVFTEKNGAIGPARHSPELRAWLKNMAANGYLEWNAVAGESKYVHRSRIRTFWEPIVDGTYSMSDGGVVYSLQEPESGVKAKKLLILLSSIHFFYNSPKLERYFMPGYKHMSGLTTSDVAILRIADVGGVVGSFYMDTADSPKNESAVFSLIDETVVGLGLDRSDVCLLGSSKGGFGALLHGLLGGYSFVSVDPIVDDTYYVEDRNDAHFTGAPIFFETKQDRLARLCEDVFVESPSLIFTSRNSRQYELVHDFAAKLSENLTFVETEDPLVKKHEDVAKGVLGPTVAAINDIFLKWPIPTGHLTI